MASNFNDGETKPCCYSNSRALCPWSQRGAAVGFGEQAERRRLWTSGWPWEPLPTILGWGPGEEQGGLVALLDKGYGPPRAGVQLRAGQWDRLAQYWASAQNGGWSSSVMESRSEWGDVKMESRPDGPVQNGEPSDSAVVLPSVGVQIRLGVHPIQNRGPFQNGGGVVSVGVQLRLGDVQLRAGDPS